MVVSKANKSLLSSVFKSRIRNTATVRDRDIAGTSQAVKELLRSNNHSSSGNLQTTLDLTIFRQFQPISIIGILKLNSYFNNCDLESEFIVNFIFLFVIDLVESPLQDRVSNLLHGMCKYYFFNELSSCC